MNQKQKDTIREEKIEKFAKRFADKFATAPYPVADIKEYIQSEIDQAYQAGAKDKVEEVDNILKKELSTWAKESIGAKAVESVQRAISDKSLKDNT
jgi:type II secretory pathway predicted ATPase ExeA